MDPVIVWNPKVDLLFGSAQGLDQGPCSSEMGNLGLPLKGSFKGEIGPYKGHIKPLWSGLLLRKVT